MNRPPVAVTNTELEVSQPAPSIVLESRRGWSLDLKSLWDYRELVYFLVWRDVKVRYKQTAVGIAWVILQPLFTTMLFLLIFSRLARIPSDGVPYPLFAYSALLSWNLFAQSLTRGGDSVVQNANLITKIYFPRLILPMAAILSPLVDFTVGFLMLAAMMGWYGVTPGIQVLALPLFIVLTITTALAVSLWFSALNVRYRDVTHAVPFVVQSWMFLSPVAYPVSMIPEKWRFLYSLNPMAGVIEGFRWALLGHRAPDFQVIAISTAVVLAILIPGLIYFRQTERTFADVI